MNFEYTCACLIYVIKTNMVHNVVFVTKSVDIQTVTVAEWLQKASVFPYGGSKISPSLYVN